MQIFYSVIVAFFIVFFFYLVTHSIKDTPKKRKAAVEEAIRAGHVVTAVRTKRRFTRKSIPGTHEFWSSIGYYKYEYKGKTYTYKYWADEPPATLKLYFVRNPARATVSGALSPVTTNWGLIYVIVVLLVRVLLF